MGKEQEREERLKIFKPYQLNSRLLAKAKPDCMVMHCLPAHRGEEITDEVMASQQNISFDQAENRLHVQKAILTLLLG
jgi:ornithine carbamoyltransferase